MRWGLFAATVGALLTAMPIAPTLAATQARDDRGRGGVSSATDEADGESDRADIQERGVGGSRADTTGQSAYTDYSMGVDIPPGAGGSRSDLSGQPDYTDNHMGVDTRPGRGGY